MESSQSQIRITRGEAWTDKLRAYRVWVDGRSVGDIREGGELVVPVAPGTHALQLRIGWCASPVLQVMVAPGRVEHVACGPRYSAFMALLAATVYRKTYLQVERVIPRGVSARSG